MTVELPQETFEIVSDLRHDMSALRIVFGDSVPVAYTMGRAVSLLCWLEAELKRAKEAKP